MIFGIGSYSGDTFSRDTNIALQSIAITKSTTIQDVASQINSLSGTGLSASVVKTGDANFSLVVKSQLGASKKIHMSTQDTNNSNGLGVNNEIAAISYTPRRIQHMQPNRLLPAQTLLLLLMEFQSLGLQTS